MEELAATLAAAGPAHHPAYRETDGHDPEWPLWYAEHLQEDLSRLLGVPFTISRLVYLSMEEERTAAASPEPWPQFYPRRLQERRHNGDLV